MLCTSTLLNANNFIEISPSNSTIQAAENNVIPGDAILLDGGNYTGEGNYNINITKADLKIYASGIGGVPVIDAQGQGRIFNVISDRDVLSGLDIRNGRSNFGGGVYIIGSDVSVTSCSFVGCLASSGSAIQFNGIYGYIMYNRFVNNSGSGNGINITGGGVNVDYNWYGNNTPDSIPGAVMNNYYLVRLTANTTTKSLSSIMSGAVFHMQPGDVTLGYDLVLNNHQHTDSFIHFPFIAINRCFGLTLISDATRSCTINSYLRNLGNSVTLNTRVDNLAMNITALADEKGS